jgi:hypothetical protein
MPMKIEVEKLLGSPEIKERLAKNPGISTNAQSKPLNIGYFSVNGN